MRVVVPLLVGLVPVCALASSGGIAGRGASGCSTCHGGADAAVTTTLVPAKTTVAPGEKITVTVDLGSTDTAHRGGGLSVDATGGTFVAGSGTRVLSGDITHSAPRSFSGRATSWTFSWRAPATEGTVTLRAAGNAVNLDTMASALDGWDLAPAVSILVQTPCPDGDGDGVCDTADLCLGDDATGDGDGDGVCDDLDLCLGDDATGDADGDGVCDDQDFTLDASAVVPGQTLTLTVANGPANRPVYLFGSLRAPGSGPCAPTAPSVCVDLVGATILGSVRTDASGAATYQVTVPALPAGATVRLQAAYVIGAVGDVTEVEERAVP